MKTYCGSGGIAPRILDLCTKWRWVVRFTPRPLYPQGKSPGTHWIGGVVGPRAVLDTVVKRKIPSPRRESNSRIPIVQPVAQRYTDWAIRALGYTKIHNDIYLLAHSMVQDILWKTDSHSACQTIACFLYGTRRFIDVLTKARHWILSWANTLRWHINGEFGQWYAKLRVVLSRC
jgi:hypothetical protein